MALFFEVFNGGIGVFIVLICFRSFQLDRSCGSPSSSSNFSCHLLLWYSFSSFLTLLRFVAFLMSWGSMVLCAVFFAFRFSLMSAFMCCGISKDSSQFVSILIVAVSSAAVISWVSTSICLFSVVFIGVMTVVLFLRWKWYFLMILFV